MVKIQDYAVIGNSRSAALISKEGSLDWLCWPKFDSPSLFAAILDPGGGFWKISPHKSKEIKREYIESTNVLKTRFSTETGVAILTDFMSVSSEEEKKKTLYPDNEIVRYVEVVSGFVDLEIIFQPKPNYALTQVKLNDKGKLGLRIESPNLITLHSLCKFRIENNVAYCSLRLNQNDYAPFSLTFHSDGPAILSLLDRESILKKIQETTDWWQNWASKINYSGEYKDEVVRSALALKLLNYAPSGTFVAAPTTSLPEKIGGPYNWDYRFSWLRDAAFISKALYELELYEESYPFINWLLYSTTLSFSRLGVLYDIYGRYCGLERILKHLKGFQNSKPVRIGNAASRQFQLDVNGEVVESVYLFVPQQKKHQNLPLKQLIKLGEFICKNWHKPDNGIWEYRSIKKIHTYSLLMCWLIFERVLSMKVLKLDQKKKVTFQTAQQCIREFIENKCWNSALNSYTDTPGGKDIGVSLLQLAIYGFDSPTSLRMKGTYLRIQEKLRAAPSLYYRNEIAIKRGEGAFLMCSFWNVQYLAACEGTFEQANESFRESLRYCNDVGLLAEEFNPKTQDALGNFPQGLSHAGLINAAIALQKGIKHA
jgi:GH15 family glucan-1,4-alpha-glucosidase